MKNWVCIIIHVIIAKIISTCMYSILFLQERQLINTVKKIWLTLISLCIIGKWCRCHTSWIWLPLGERWLCTTGDGCRNQIHWSLSRSCEENGRQGWSQTGGHCGRWGLNFTGGTCPPAKMYSVHTCNIHIYRTTDYCLKSLSC